MNGSGVHVTSHDMTNHHLAGVEADIESMARFLEAVAHDPSMTERIPTGATIFVVPEDDPERGWYMSRAPWPRAGRAGMFTPGSQTTNMCIVNRTIGDGLTPSTRLPSP